MKKFLKILIHHPILVIAIIILVVYLPAGLSLAPEGIKRQHVATIGIDIVEENVEVSLLSYFSTESQGFQENYLFVSAIAPTIPEALRQIEINSGRDVALTHTTVIVISEKVAEAGLEKYLDFFYRDDTVSNNAHIICAKGTAKEVLKYEQQIVNSINVGLEELSLYNSQSVLFTDINLESFYKGYFSQVKSSFLGLLEISETASGSSSGGGGQGGSSSGGGSSGGENGAGGSSSGASSSPTELQIKSFDEVLVLKDGKAKLVLNRDDIRAMNFLNAKATGFDFQILGVNDDFYDDVDMTLRVEKNLVKRRGYFENGKPVFEANIMIQVSIDEILSDKLKPEYFSNKKNLFTEAVVKKIEAKVKGDFSALLQKLIENRTDVLGVFSVLHDQQFGRFMGWYNDLENKDDFLSLITFKMTVIPTLTI